MRRRINLVPLSERPRTTTDVGLLLTIAAVVVVVFGLGFGYFLLNNDLTAKKQELAGLEQQVSLVESQIAALRQYEVIKTQKDQVEALVEGIYAARTVMSDVLDDISLVIPESTWFQKLSLTAADPVPSTRTAARPSTQPTRVGIEGTTYSFEDVAQLLVRLQLVPSLKEVELVSASGSRLGDSEQQLKTFTMRGFVVDTFTDEPLPLSQVQVNTP